jgi:hypothetical protein
MSRLAAPSNVEVVSVVRPFSNFDFADDRFQGSFPIRRLFSQARSRDCRTVVLEDIPAAGAVADENGEIKGLFPDHHMQALRRVSFWRSKFKKENKISAQDAGECIGFAILKHDGSASQQVDEWHVFESVVVQYPHQHNFLPCANDFEVRVAGSKFKMRGVLYCQQNGLNKACAQVALRSICATYLNEPNFTYRRINALAFRPGEPFTPGKGLNTRQILRVLDGLKIPYFDIYYPARPAHEKWRAKLPYQKVVYSGVESGSGALLAFTMAGPRASNVGHIVPVFGHTFNEDTWAPNAEGDYFRVGHKIRYIPSEAWLSSLIAHDDNFGSNLCIPKDFIHRKRADFAVALRPRGFEYPGFVAEIVASDYFYSMLPQLDGLPNRWMKRLRDYVSDRKLILRTVPNSRADYLTHLSAMEDWQEKRESPQTVKDIGSMLPERLWIVEVSIPDLFSTNKRKLGELLLDATRPYTGKGDYSFFVLARLPGVYAFFDRLDGRRHTRFLAVRSEIQTHTPVQSVRAANV